MTKKLITTEQAISLLPKRRQWIKTHIDNICTFGPHQVKSDAIKEKMKTDFNVFIDPKYIKEGYGLSVNQNGHTLYIEHDKASLDKLLLS